jgi:hypothetical protein
MKRKSFVLAGTLALLLGAGCAITPEPSVGSDGQEVQVEPPPAPAASSVPKPKVLQTVGKTVSPTKAANREHGSIDSN